MDGMQAKAAPETALQSLGPWDLNVVHNEDALVGLKEIPSDTLDVVVTSPPYWGQREGDGLGHDRPPRLHREPCCGFG